MNKLKIKDLTHLAPVGMIYSKYDEEKRKKENYSNDNQSLLSYVLGILMAVSAIYLSWSCNTVKKVPVILKVLYAFFAFLFAPIYLLCYAIFIQPCKACV